MKRMKGERKKKEPLGNNCSHLSKRECQWRRVDRYIIRKNKWSAYLLDMKDGGK